jgi:hypothetical protein
LFFNLLSTTFAQFQAITDAITSGKRGNSTDLGACSSVAVCGREIVCIKRNISDKSGSAPLVTATLDMDRRLLHHDGNVKRLKPLYEKYGSTAAYAEWLSHECLLVFGSQLPDVSTDQLIDEFRLETMRDYLARVRTDRQLALKGLYKPSKKKQYPQTRQFPRPTSSLQTPVY